MCENFFYRLMHEEKMIRHVKTFLRTKLKISPKISCYYLGNIFFIDVAVTPRVSSNRMNMCIIQKSITRKAEVTVQVPFRPVLE